MEHVFNTKLLEWSMHLIQRYLNGACITKALEWGLYYNGT